MRKPSQLITIILLGTAACATNASPDDELAGETGDEDGKADGDGVFTFWQVERSADGFQVSRPNRTVTSCGGGVRGESCDVASLDLAGTVMPDSVARSFVDRLGAGESILLRGELADDYGPAIAGADLVPVLPPTVPSIHVGDESGPDCLYARLFVQDVAVSTATFTTTALGSNRFEFRARFGGVSIPSTSEHAVACVNGTSTINVKIATLTSSGIMTVAADGSIAMESTTHQLDGVTFDSAAPQVVLDMLFGNELAVGNIVTSSVAVALAPMVKNGVAARALAATEVWVPGSSDASDLSGVFVLAAQAGNHVFERRVNSTRTATIDEVDLAASGATQDVVERATVGLAGDGVLLVGFRYIENGKHGRAANQFWTRAPVPLH